MLSGLSRRWLSSLALFAFVVFLLFLRLVSKSLNDPFGRPSKGQPDYAQYIHVQTLSDEQVGFDDLRRRVIMVGDIHGMKKSLDKLLDKLSYNPSNDLLIHVGDVMTKGTNPFKVVSFLAENNITGVRGNHDQKIIQWRAWVDEVLRHPGGQEWLEQREDDKRFDFDSVKKRYKEPWQRVPKGWKFMGPHYKMARKLTELQYDYLRSLPLVLHIPVLHAFVAHAGILPSDPSRRLASERQPLSHVPEGIPGGNVTLMRMAQERAILKEINQNQDPWVLLNIRSVLKDGTITRDTDEGTFWADLWNSAVSRCGGFDRHLEIDSNESRDTHVLLEASSKKYLPCHPATVIYGHTASQGLDLRRWTKGLDSGCVYGRRLSALVLTPPGVVQEDHVLDELLPYDPIKEDTSLFGDDGSRTANARVVSVSCPKA